MRHNLIFKHNNTKKYRQCIIHSIILGMSYTAKNTKKNPENTTPSQQLKKIHWKNNRNKYKEDDLTHTFKITHFPVLEWAIHCPKFILLFKWFRLVRTMRTLTCNYKGNNASAIVCTLTNASQND
jgi:hypothetical protein